MPGNVVKINNFDTLTWYIGDSQMDDLMEYLDQHGYRMDETESADAKE